MNQPHAVAGIDIGTNSVKMLVRRGTERHRFVQTVRLGEGVHRSGELHPDAVERTLEALRGFARTADEHGVTALAAVATSATRDARNREAFLQAVESVLGTRPLVLSGVEEGRLAYRGSCIDLPDGIGSPRLVLDIGGGSTEFVIGDTDVRSAFSVDVGCIRLTERELRADPPRPEELSNAIGHVQDHLDDVIRDMPAILDIASVVGIGGTISTVAAVEIGRMDPSDLHGFWLSRDAAEDVFRTLATERLADRLHNPGLPPDRAPIIVGGLCVLVAVLRKLKADGLTVSQRNAIDGICAMLLEGTWPGGGAPS